MLKPHRRAELSFEYLAEISQEGKNSRVFKATDNQMKAQLVIKQIKKSTMAQDEFFDESSILYLSSHPNVVPIHYACEDNDYVYLAMPYYAAGSLNRLISSRFLTVREVIKYAAQFLSGLHNIHSKRLVHFDIKPDNILISEQGEAVVSDFGLAKQSAFNGYAEQDRMYLKTKPPEAFQGNQFTNAFDIYQVGLTLYRMCVGNKEFYKQFDQYGDLASFDRAQFRIDILGGRFPDRSVFPEHIPDRLRRVVKKCLQPDPSRRYSAAIQIVNELAEIDGMELDWQFDITNAGERKWSKMNLKGHEYCLNLDASGTSTATRKNDTGRVTRFTEFCSTSLDEAKIRDFLGRY